MHDRPSDFFGSDAQVALLRRGQDMYRVVKSQSQFTYYGRTVGLASPQDAPLETLVSLVRLQGNSSYADVPDEDVPGMVTELEAQGFSPIHYARWESTPDSLAIADQIASSYIFDGSLRVDWLTPKTDTKTRQSLAETCLACGVLPPSFAVLSGAAQPGVCPMVIDRDGNVIALAAAASFLHPDHPKGSTICWWGMLAVHPAHRGMGLSLPLGAYAMQAMRDRFGFSQFFTGVTPGNKPSEAICAKIGLRHEGRSIVGATDAQLLPGGRMTK